MGFNFFGLFLGLSTGNFIWQFFTFKDWHIATERSYCEGFAILMCYLSVAFWQRKSGDKGGDSND